MPPVGGAMRLPKFCQPSIWVRLSEISLLYYYFSMVIGWSFLWILGGNLLDMNHATCKCPHLSSTVLSRRLHRIVSATSRRPKTIAKWLSRSYPWISLTTKYQSIDSFSYAPRPWFKVCIYLHFAKQEEKNKQLHNCFRNVNFKKIDFCLPRQR